MENEGITKHQCWAEHRNQEPAAITMADIKKVSQVWRTGQHQALAWYIKTLTATQLIELIDGTHLKWLIQTPKDHHEASPEDKCAPHMSKAQRWTRSGTGGAKHQLLIDRTFTSDYKIKAGKLRQTNLSLSGSTTRKPWKLECNKTYIPRTVPHIEGEIPYWRFSP